MKSSFLGDYITATVTTISTGNKSGQTCICAYGKGIAYFTHRQRNRDKATIKSEGLMVSLQLFSPFKQK